MPFHTLIKSSFSKLPYFPSHEKINPFSACILGSKWNRMIIPPSSENEVKGVGGGGGSTIHNYWYNQVVYIAAPASCPDVSLSPSVPFPWSLAVHYQSLAPTMRKTKRLRRRLLWPTNTCKDKIKFCSKHEKKIPTGWR